MHNVTFSLPKVMLGPYSTMPYSHKNKNKLPQSVYYSFGIVLLFFSNFSPFQKVPSQLPSTIKCITFINCITTVLFCLAFLNKVQTTTTLVPSAVLIYHKVQNFLRPEDAMPRHGKCLSVNQHICAHKRKPSEPVQPIL